MFCSWGCGRNRTKDSVKFFIPVCGSSRKTVGPHFVFMKIPYDSPPLAKPHVCWVKDSLFIRVVRLL